MFEAKKKQQQKSYWQGRSEEGPQLYIHTLLVKGTYIVVHNHTAENVAFGYFSCSSKKKKKMWSEVCFIFSPHLTQYNIWSDISCAYIRTCWICTRKMSGRNWAHTCSHTIILSVRHITGGRNEPERERETFYYKTWLIVARCCCEPSQLPRDRLTEWSSIFDDDI